MLNILTKIVAIIYIASFVGIIVGLVCLLPTFAKMDLTGYIPKVPLREMVRGRITLVSTKVFIVSMILIFILRVIGGIDF